ncbi:mobility group protein 1A-like [Harmonia axyridis]|uniref:mobility group protein 1A-like n=1 Tax=Harmonia axyridis TaxID=115357 RepID=UPI001E2763E0|nr:mobility group protein 1A-like [Harmonia axyridis]
MKKGKKVQDKDKPKRPQTAFMLWLNEIRNKIKSKNPDMKVTEIAKEGGRQWRELKDKSKWETKAKEFKRLYEEAMQAYKAKQDVD